MACGPPQGAVEAEFTEKLERVAAWHVQSDELVLADDDGGELLRFNVPSLSGNWTAFSTYQVDSVSSLLEGTEITASFEDGTLTGSAGCNTYRATYESGRGTLKISPPAGTRMSCPEPAGVMEQEQTYLAALPEVARYSLEGDQLFSYSGPTERSSRSTSAAPRTSAASAASRASAARERACRPRPRWPARPSSPRSWCRSPRCRRR